MSIRYLIQCITQILGPSVTLFEHTDVKDTSSLRLRLSANDCMLYNENSVVLQSAHSVLAHASQNQLQL